mmetsp:Transcript_158419/g.280903  ORF Transcript_158419/g.280903 Transcript_158419/m.280903 type:complete len:297 (+) Transcript_158419:2-892(+)
MDCPQGTVAAIAYSLPALESEDGDASSLEVVKLLYHQTSRGGYALDSSMPASWQQHWLVAVASLVRFVYLKWVNVPQEDDSEEDQSNSSAGLPGLRRHQEFLFRHSVSEFVASGIYDLEITENSVVFSEAFAFASFCRLHDVSLVLESGVYKGVSTEVWSLLVQDVIATDIFLAPEAKSRLQKRRNVQLLEGDGRRLLPALLDEHASRKTAIFIDGPKGELAIRLALSLRERPQVAFVAMHDMAPYRQELRKFGAFFFTDEPWFQEAYGHLDAPYKSRPDLEAGGTMVFLLGAGGG